MKRTIIALAVCLVSAMAVVAQNNEKISRWSLQAGYDLTIPGKYRMPNGASEEMFRNGSGFTIGFGYYQPIYAGIYFEPSFLIDYSTMRAKDLRIAIGENGDKFIDDPAFRRWNIVVPAYFGYRFGIAGGRGIRVFTGPEVQYCFSGRIGIDKDIAAENDIDRNIMSEKSLFPMQHINGGWGFGVGFDDRHFFLQFSGTVGFTDILNTGEGGPRMFENHARVILGYYF